MLRGLIEERTGDLARFGSPPVNGFQNRGAEAREEVVGEPLVERAHHLVSLVVMPGSVVRGGEVVQERRRLAVHPDRLFEARDRFLGSILAIEVVPALSDLGNIGRVRFDRVEKNGVSIDLNGRLVELAGRDEVGTVGVRPRNACNPAGERPGLTVGLRTQKRDELLDLGERIEHLFAEGCLILLPGIGHHPVGLFGDHIAKPDVPRPQPLVGRAIKILQVHPGDVVVPSYSSPELPCARLVPRARERGRLVADELLRIAGVKLLAESCVPPEEVDDARIFSRDGERHADDVELRSQGELAVGEPTHEF